METKIYNEDILVTDWEEVDKDDFYLSSDWEDSQGEERIKQARDLQNDGKLFIGYIVPAVHYAIYQQMDASQIFIDEDGNEIISCEGAIIGNKHEHKEEHSY